MKRFSTWLRERQPGLERELRQADADYRGAKVDQRDATGQVVQVALSQARGNSRLNAKDKVSNLGNLLQKLVTLYWSDVCGPVYTALGGDAARRAMSVEWDMLLHAPGSAKMANIDSFIAAVDEFARKFRLRKGDFVLWENYALGDPGASDDAFIPQIGKGFSDSYDYAEQPHLPFAGEIKVEDQSKVDFEHGAPGSAWIGLLTISQRTGGGPHMLYLVPALHMEKHLSMPHLEGVKPVEQWGASGHHEALFRCIAENRINTRTWHRTEYTPEPGKGLRDIKECSYVGCVLGFAMVRAYNAIGHQWAFISGTLQPTGTGDWTKQGELYVMKKKGDDFSLPKSWALAIWKSTKDLSGNITLPRGRLKLPTAMASAAAPPPQPKAPPPPPPGGRRAPPLSTPSSRP